MKLKNKGQLALAIASTVAIGAMVTALVVSPRRVAPALTLVQPAPRKAAGQRQSLGQRVATKLGLNSFRTYLIAKRWLDIVVSASAIVFLAPLMLVIAALIKLDSKGPAIFKQERVGARIRGKGGKKNWEVTSFTIYKFRTMAANNDASEHKKFVQAMIKKDDATLSAINGGQAEGENKYKIKNDKRVTRIGKFLRKTSLDELPQLFNVLKGDMSIVGPRPAIPYEVEMYEPHHMRRLEAQQGFTGWWQVTARSNVDFETMVELDAWYAKHQNLWLDIKIIVMTPFAILKGKGAA
jgi:lipopolysaccharide/colanic/teichoic acid biosynthesis glycosyltransferase